MLTTARNVIAQEIQGLHALSDALGEPFEQAVTLIAGLKGKLIVSGMGKSGHIARKIAATLASTGTPAFYIHPGEASHGDLGMIGAEDAVLLLSNSGETAELSDITHYASRRGLPLIAMVRRAPSTLADAATIALVVPATPEAAAFDVPTTSSTMMLVLGDALAVTLMQKRGFGHEDFGHFHPGGKLGKAYIRVRDLMHRGEAMPLISPSTPLPEVLLTMTSHGFGCAGVVEAGKLVGIVTDGDLRRHMGVDLLTKHATHIMTANPLTIRPTALASEAVAVMNQRKITTLFVIEDGVAEGIVHLHDCLRAGVS